MNNMSKNKIVDELCLTIAKTLAEVEIGKEAKGAGFYVWPMPIFHPTEGEIYTAPHFLPKLYEALIKLRNKGYNNQKIAQLFKNPSRISQIVWLFTAFETTPLKKEEKTDIAFQIVKLISAYRTDPFCRNRKNIIWSRNKIKEIFKKAHLIKSSKESKKVLGRLNGITWLLCELLYFDFHGAGHEFHGPYKLDNNKVLIIREYYDLKPDHWNFTSQLLFNKITTLELYNKKCKIEFDFFNRTRWTEPISQYLQEFSIFVNDELIKELDKVKLIVNELEQMLKVGVKEITKMNKKELIKKFAESYFFIIKSLQEELGKDWMPPKLFVSKNFS